MRWSAGGGGGGGGDTLKSTLNWLKFTKKIKLLQPLAPPFLKIPDPELLEE